MLRKFRESLEVYRVEKSRVIVIVMSSSDPRLAAEIPNTLADEYIATQGAAKLQSNAEATDWLEPEIASLSRRVKEAEARVASFRAQSDLLVGQNNSVLATQQLSELSSELSRVRAARAAAEANASNVRAVLDSGASLDALPDVLSSQLIQRLREREVQLRADIADLSTTLLDNHPRIRALRSQLSDLDRQIRAEARNVLSALSAEADAARLREQQLVADLNTLKAESARAGEEEVELRALEREANAQRELLESYLARYREASSRRDGNYLPADARIFSRAIIPAEPYYPKPLTVALAAFIGSLLMMAIVTLLQELFSGRAMRPAPGSRLDLEDAQPEAVAHDVEPVVERPFVPAADDAMPATGEPARAPAEPELPAVVVVAADADAVAPDDAAVADPVPPAAETDTGIDEAAAKAEPIRLEPLPEMRVRRESFSEAWARHRRMMDAGQGETGVEPADDATGAGRLAADEEEIEEGRSMRNPFARWISNDNPESAAPGSAEAAGQHVGEVGIESAAELLIAGGATRAIFVSPEGDDGAAAAVMVAREVSDAGLRVLLLDLTASGAASRPMLGSVGYAGITNLLVSEAQFTDAIQLDHYSECHVMPVGTADPVRAMKAADRLPAIMQSLTGAYDVVVVECGAADADGIRRLISDGTEIMVSAIEPDDETMETAEELRARGYGRVMLVSPQDYGSPDGPVPGRSVA
ncbi:exopolysaccharide transport family protein [Mesorhizobium marinum]|uniref:exopolysaccharide transport family protein n=1 Tax=Mesorhizobium marinum TaxID=3228790 RepID=UPI003467CF9F